MTKLSHKKFIALCEEAGSILGYKQIWQAGAEEPLQDIIDNFLETGKIEYTKIPFLIPDGRDEKKEKVSFKPKGDKVFLWKTAGRFRKRPESVGGNIKEIYDK